MKNKYLLILLSPLVFFITAFNLFEDWPFIKELKQKLQAYNQAYPQEKIYVQTDKPLYQPAETIWFNTMVLHSNTHQPSQISDVVYVELVDPKGSIMKEVKLAIKEGAAKGDFELPYQASGGLYRLRAYTTWMKNFGKQYIFEKELIVQRVITPRLLLKLDFERKAYGPGDSVEAKLRINNLRNEKEKGAVANFTVYLQGEKTLVSSSSADEQGIARIRFRLSDSLSGNDGLLHIVVRTKKEEEESIARSIPIVLNKISLDFFAEGGYSVEGVSSQIGFKALNEFGKGADVAGVIVDDQQRVVSGFSSFHHGMGSFELKPEAGRRYFARIEKPVGNGTLRPLPSSLKEGYVLNVDAQDSTHIKWRIEAPRAGAVYLVGRSQGELVYSERKVLGKGGNSWQVGTGQLAIGIVVFTLFDSLGREQCERLVFVNKHKGLKIELHTDKSQYAPREKVNLKVKTLDGQGRPVRARVSVSVVDEQLLSLADDRQDNLLSYMLLSSEVKGKIEEPSFYFDPLEPKSSKAMDYLLMTQGWRRFGWREVMEQQAHPITYKPEKVKDIEGFLYDKKGKGYSGNVFILEIPKDKEKTRNRIAKVKSMNEGYFMFKNTDLETYRVLLTKHPGNIMLRKKMGDTVFFNDKQGTILLKKKASSKSDTLSQKKIENKSEDNLKIGEIIGPGLPEKPLIEVRRSSTIQDAISLEQVTVVINEPIRPLEALAGRLAGISIKTQDGNPGSNSYISIRGLSSLATHGGGPLFVINGFALGPPLSLNFSTESVVSADNIIYINILNDASATVLYGSQAANGIISFTTRSAMHFSQGRSKYSALIIEPQEFSPTRDFEVAPPEKNTNNIRKDFRTTIYWNPSVLTNEKGEATLEFYNNEALSAFKITAEGFTSTGDLGRKEQIYSTQIPVSLDLKLPEYIGLEDILKLPVKVKNQTSQNLAANLSLQLPAGLSVQQALEQTIEVPANTTQTFVYTLQATAETGNFTLGVLIKTLAFNDQINHTLQVKPIGFPRRLSFSGRSLNDSVKFSILEAEKNSLKAEVSVFPDPLTDLMTGVESILREPYGCFEQVSSSTFPNILALQFLNDTGLINSTVEQKALDYIKKGYEKLLSYEIKGGGFEWFGNPPAHEGLTAYGLLEFYEMAKVYHKVDKKIIERTRQWLLSRRDGQGEFKTNQGKYGFSGASSKVTNAYLVYALSETGTTDIIPEYSKALSEALRSKDMYRMALMANAAFKLGKTEDYFKLIKIFRDKIYTHGFTKISAEHSITRSYGNSLTCETVSLWALAFLKEGSTDSLLVDCIQEILKFRGFYGGFSSTQATILALKALTQYARLLRTTQEDGEINLTVNNRQAAKISYKKDSFGKLVSDLSPYLNKNGENTLKIDFSGVKEPLPYLLSVEWYTKTPPADANCKVDLTTTLSSPSIKVNETVRLKALLKNKTSEGLPMVVAIIGIPAGLSLQPWQLKELQEKKVFDFYEIIEGNLVVYYREMAPKAEQIVNLDLKAEVPGSYLGAASSAYLYYTSEHKSWVKGNFIVIK